PGNQKIFACRECHHLCYNREQLEWHILLAHNNKADSKPQYMCKKCGEEFWLYSTYDDHMWKKHEYERPPAEALPATEQSFNRWLDLQEPVKKTARIDEDSAFDPWIPQQQQQQHKEVTEESLRERLARLKDRAVHTFSNAYAALTNENNSSSSHEPTGSEKGA